MAKDKLKAMPKTKYFGTKTKEQTTNRINDSKETIVFHFILPTAERMFPNKFLESMLKVNANSKILKAIPLVRYFAPNISKMFSLKKYPSVKMMMHIGRNIL